MFCFQFWDFFVSLTIAEHCTAIMLIHHALAGGVCWLAIKYQYLHHFGIFFLGGSEISSTFLVIIDFAKFFPPTEGTAFSLLVSICQPAFALTFLYYRVGVWMVQSIDLWQTVIEVRVC